jgi:hypothetical protein
MPMASLAQIPDIFDAARSLGIAISPATPTIGAEISGLDPTGRCRRSRVICCARRGCASR